jgi:hypothetical protein
MTGFDGTHQTGAQDVAGGFSGDQRYTQGTHD